MRALRRRFPAVTPTAQEQAWEGLSLTSCFGPGRTAGTAAGPAERAPAGCRYAAAGSASRRCGRTGRAPGRRVLRDGPPGSAHEEEPGNARSAGAAARHRLWPLYPVLPALLAYLPECNGPVTFWALSIEPCRTRAYVPRNPPVSAYRPTSQPMQKLPQVSVAELGKRLPDRAGRAGTCLRLPRKARDAR